MPSTPAARSPSVAVQVQPLLPLAATPASPGPRHAPLHRQPQRKRVRRLLLLALVAFLLGNACRAWLQKRPGDHQPSSQGLEQAGKAADSAIDAARDSAAALGSAAGAVKHTATAAGQAAGAALNVAGPAATKAAQAVSATAKGAANTAADAFTGSQAADETATTDSKSQAKRPAREVLPFPEVAAASSDTCAQALSLPKVALLFLTYGELRHEAAWTRWLESAAGMLPAHTAQAAVCEEGRDYEALRRACAAEVPGSSGGSSIIERQHLFSVYVHAPPNVTGYPSGSLWEGHLVTHRVLTSWGDISLVEAARSLLWEAYKDPLNQRFVLLSESDIPLYDPLTFHQQLTAEGKSRVNACAHGAMSEWRWSHEMETEHLKAIHWRKSGQFFGLTRAHAEVVLRDEEVLAAFQQHCWSAWEPRRKAWRDCFPDEHYIPTLLAVHGLEGEAECGSWGVAAQDWSKGGAHPKEYSPDKVSPTLVHSVRDPARCNGSAAYEDAQRVFVGAAAVLGVDRQAACKQVQAAASSSAYAHPLPGTCPLTARKFPADTVAAVQQLFDTACSPQSDSQDLSAGAVSTPSHLLSAAYCQRAAPPAASEQQ
ncbi:hypothetical protein D9Q98_010355 [Chlorella vulgaris]|uniref:Uncharacterized protein n=1 Tax=Chlorella vulgaris TaxID=3077 RepID=A0A9D4TJY1_CHLVU|nr:hypothetical protein D9Q98_010355 [Chlorella vulgaris]